VYAPQVQSSGWRCRHLAKSAKDHPHLTLITRRFAKWRHNYGRNAAPSACSRPDTDTEVEVMGMDCRAARGASREDAESHVPATAASATREGGSGTWWNKQRPTRPASGVEQVTDPRVEGGRGKQGNAAHNRSSKKRDAEDC
jgi:hypothetical protein